MQNVERYEILVLGSGEAGKWTAWAMADEGHRTAMVERKWLGGSCPNIACLAQERDLLRESTAFGFEASELMAAVQTAMVGGMPLYGSARRDLRASDDARGTSFSSRTSSRA